jgi:uncharacterized RDD family membrane protein YckC|tara:strand:- start:93 stop:668 length:576 start_codon:yes stop_codon:yes gene_type:complete
VNAVSNYNFAGFWIRFAAAFIDGIVMFALFIPVVLTVFSFGGTAENTDLALNGLFLIGAVLYHTYFVSSAYQGTPGKIWLDLKVVNYDGQRVSEGVALGRALAHWLSSIILFIGYIMIGFTDRKQGLHDYLARTYVVQKIPKTPIGDDSGFNQTFDPSKNPAEQLRDLKELLDGGIITASEFEEEKRKILR